MTNASGVLAGERSWRLPLGFRVFFGAVEALALLFVVWLPAPAGSSSGPVTRGVIAALFLVFLLLSWRIWQVSVTLTVDTLVIRNMFGTRRVRLTQIAGLTVGRNHLSVAEAGPLTPAGYRLPARSRTVRAVPTAGAYWTGLRSEADVIADAIAAAAGLPPQPPRRQWIGRRAAWLLFAAGLACVSLGYLFGPPHVAAGRLSAPVYLTGTGLWIIAVITLPVSIPATISHVRNR